MTRMPLIPDIPGRPMSVSRTSRNIFICDVSEECLDAFSGQLTHHLRLAMKKVPDGFPDFLIILDNANANHRIRKRLLESSTIPQRGYFLPKGDTQRHCRAMVGGYFQPSS